MAAVKDRDGRTRVLHSKRRAKTGRAAPSVASWRRLIRLEARAAMAGRAPFDAPVRLALIFYLPRPKSRKGVRWPDRKPDLDKLIRAVGDALEGVVLTQDSRIVQVDAKKFYGTPGLSCFVQEVSE